MVTYVLNIFNSIFCCLDIRQLQMIFTSQIILDISLSIAERNSSDVDWGSFIEYVHTKGGGGSSKKVIHAYKKEGVDISKYLRKMSLVACIL